MALFSGLALSVLLLPCFLPAGGGSKRVLERKEQRGMDVRGATEELLKSAYKGSGSKRNGCKNCKGRDFGQQGLQQKGLIKMRRALTAPIHHG